MRKSKDAVENKLVSYQRKSRDKQSEGGIHYEFIPEGQTVNKELYLEILKRLRDAIRRKRPEKWATNDWFLLCDNAPPHRALIVKKYLARHSVTTLEHPPYSPDIEPADFYLFPRLKMKLKGHHFVDSDEVIENATKKLKDLSKMDSRSVLNSYTNAGRSMSMQEESTLKANKLKGGSVLDSGQGSCGFETWIHERRAVYTVNI
ncbi:hypothetical protein AVEN_50488-1 [Araneus ventricosus]|uniref:Mariner Mos1 transposase n=1 Tax=Araneus ventricosus TaxID=182803 RepID=A0A4Y2AQ57_ARAVE|nr:hypothetical protein AVEN_50488-1 [Araneus ventricosus]